MDFSEKSKQLNQYNTNLYNLNTNHPLQVNSQSYFNYKKYVSIHSEDRDINKYPSSSLFEIELPEAITNVTQVNLANWSFPVNYNSFSSIMSNITMTFQINTPYNPFEHDNNNPLQIAIFKALFDNINQNYTIQIEEGFYNPIQMTTELTNKFNEVVTLYLYNYFTDKGYITELNELKLQSGYQRFVIVYNSVKQNIWFGNRCDEFVLTNDTQLLTTTLANGLLCGSKRRLPDFSNWGLPGNLGLTRKNEKSFPSLNEFNCRFYYGDVFPGDNGFWLTPEPYALGCIVYFVECPNKINLMGDSYFYIEIVGLNCIDETSPYNLSTFTDTTNETNGVVNSAFAKIPIPCTPISQSYDLLSPSYKLFIPPAERIKKMLIKIRYHNGQLVDFGIFNFSFTLEFYTLIPAQNRSYNIQSYNSSVRL